MSETNLTPALSAEAWRDILDRRVSPYVDIGVRSEPVGTEVSTRVLAGGRHGAMAVANYLLPDTDPRKITWEVVTQLNDAARISGDTPFGVFLRNLAAKLAALLPPR